jgi:hypothetical protein
MTSFAERTGLGSDRPQQRYLWTDAFAVCNFLELARATGERRCEDLALRLVDRVHHTLGRHRPDDPRRGWISGLGEQEGEAHPTRGGLRIGKSLPERGPSEPFDDALEWERDGQYFHYLTKWMHALDQASRSTRQPRFNVWARELARAAHAAFVHARPGGGRPRMVWKMSVDLSRPLVPSMGQHDPLDGLVTCAQLQTTAWQLPQPPEGPSLEKELASYRSMIEVGSWATADPLGLGGLLMDAYRVAQLAGGRMLAEGKLLPALLEGAAQGLRQYAGQHDFEQPVWRRLPFRELGLAIGLHAVELMDAQARSEPLGVASDRSPVSARLDALHPYVPLGAWLESFWLDPGHRDGRTWSEHRDINEVMLATSLVPEGCLVLRSLD